MFLPQQAPGIRSYEDAHTLMVKRSVKCPLFSLWQLYTTLDARKMSLCQETDMISHVIFIHLQGV